MEEAIVLLSICNFDLKQFLSPLCQLIKADWHFKHEDVARFLQDAKSPTTVNCLYEAAKLQFKYLDYDDSYQFARKCIKALSAIGDKNAIGKLNLLADSHIPGIALYAQKELNR